MFMNIQQLKAKVAAGEIEVISINPVVTSTSESVGREHVEAHCG
ncbi:hypothetical protein ACNKHR_01370 [Shigella flexneri]